MSSSNATTTTTTMSASTVAATPSSSSLFSARDWVHLCGIFGVGYLGTSVLLRIGLYFYDNYTENATTTKSSKGSEREEKGTDLPPTITSSQRFLWEPDTDTAATDDDDDDDENLLSKNMQARIQARGRILGPPLPQSATQINNNKKNDDDMQRLHFLSQMTFANGGIRAPSCPCCI